MIPGLLFLIIIFALILIKAADMTIVAIRRIARDSKIGIFTISSIILALGTSFPELFVGVTSAIEASPNLSFGVVIGSNIANIALIGGVSALFTGRVLIRGDYLKRDVWIAFLAGISPVLLIADGTLGRVDGLILLSVYMAYATGFFKKRFEEIGKEQQEEGFVYRFLRRFNHIESRKTKEFSRLFTGIALLLFSADVIVKLSTTLAEQAKIPLFLIGLFVIAIGTSLPEFAFSIRTLTDREPSMFFGNILGSIVANSTLIVGITSIIHPIQIQAFDLYLTSAIFFVLIFLTFWFFIRTKHRLDRWEALALLILYFAFFIVEFV